MQTRDPDPTTFKVPVRDLAMPRLMALSRALGRPPVECLSSIIEHALLEYDDQAEIERAILGASRH